jgi:hypothetical protein
MNTVLIIFIKIIDKSSVSRQEGGGCQTGEKFLFLTGKKDRNFLLENRRNRIISE